MGRPLRLRVPNGTIRIPTFGTSPLHVTLTPLLRDRFPVYQLRLGALGLGFSLYFPLMTSLIISVVLSVILWLVNR